MCTALIGLQTRSQAATATARTRLGRYLGGVLGFPALRGPEGGGGGGAGHGDALQRRLPFPLLRLPLPLVLKSTRNGWNKSGCGWAASLQIASMSRSHHSLYPEMVATGTMFTVSRSGLRTKCAPCARTHARVCVFLLMDVPVHGRACVCVCVRVCGVSPRQGGAHTR